MKFFRRTAGYILFNHERNEEILDEMKVEPVDGKLRRCKSNWLRHVTGMNSSRMARIMLYCRQNGRRRLGRPLKGLLDKAESLNQGIIRTDDDDARKTKKFRQANYTPKHFPCLINHLRLTSQGKGSVHESQPASEPTVHFPCSTMVSSSLFHATLN